MKNIYQFQKSSKWTCHISERFRTLLLINFIFQNKLCTNFLAKLIRSLHKPVWSAANWLSCLHAKLERKTTHLNRSAQSYVIELLANIHNYERLLLERLIYACSSVLYWCVDFYIFRHCAFCTLCNAILFVLKFDMSQRIIECTQYAILK